MVNLYEKETRAFLGRINEEQLQFLIDRLEEETTGDTDYYINRDTLELFEQAGADADLLHLLRQALGEREELEIYWTRE